MLITELAGLTVCVSAMLAQTTAPAGRNQVGSVSGLRAFEQYRTTRLKKALITWTSRNYDSATVPIFHFTSRFANGDHLVVNRGDDAGAIGQDSFGNPFFSRVVILWQRHGEFWSTDGDSLTAKLFPRDSRASRLPVIDIRAQDASPRLDRYVDLHSAIWKLDLEKLGPVEYSATTEKGLHVISARAADAQGNSTEYRWYLDPKRGWSPLKTEFLQQGHVVLEARITPKDYGGIWFPESIARFKRTWHEGRKPFNLVSIESARFDNGLPDELGPADIGVEVGTNIGIIGSEGQEVLIWDGTKPGNADEVWARVDKGELKRGPNFIRNSSKPRLPATMPANPILQGARSRWQRFVDAFGQEHNFSQAQDRAAQGILEDCLKRADKALAERKNDLDECRRLARDLAVTPRSDAFEKRTRLFKLHGELNRFLQTILEQQLQPRLEALLTTQQDQATQPARRSP